MGKASRDKGNRTERAIVALLQKHGFGAERVPLSGAMGGRFKSDVSVPVLGIDRKVEVKCRARGFQKIYAWLEGNDFLVIKQDRAEPLVVMPLSTAARIAEIAERKRPLVDLPFLPPLDNPETPR